MRRRETMNQTGGANSAKGIWRWVFSPISFALKHPYFTTAFLLIVGSELLVFARARIDMADIRSLLFLGGLAFLGYVLAGIGYLGKEGRGDLRSADETGDVASAEEENKHVFWDADSIGKRGLGLSQDWWT